MGYRINIKRISIQSRIKSVSKRIKRRYAKAVVQKKYYTDIKRFLDEEYGQSLALTDQLDLLPAADPAQTQSFAKGPD